MAHILVRHPAGDLRSSKSEFLPIYHRQAGGAGAAATRASDPVPRRIRPQRKPARAVDAVQTREAACDRCRASRGQRHRRAAQARGEAPRDDLGATPQTRVYSGHPALALALRPPPSALRPPPSALRASLRLFQIAPGDLVRIDVSTCVHCGGAVRIVASIEEPIAIRAHFEKHGVLEEAHYRPRPRGPPPWTWPRSRKIGHATNRDNQQRLDAAAIPQGRAWPDAGIQ